MNNENLHLFEDQPIRTAWNEEDLGMVLLHR